MVRKILSAVFWFVACVLALTVYCLFYTDYHIPISADFTLFGNDYGDGKVFLNHRRSTTSVGPIRRYREIDGSVVGESDEGFFIVDRGGTLKKFPSKDEWSRSIAKAPAVSPHMLIEPTRFRDPQWLAIFACVVALLVLWIGAGNWIGSRARKWNRSLP